MMGPIPDPVKELLASSPVCRIATVLRDGGPHIIPVCPAFGGHRTVYVDLAPRGVSAEALQSNHAIAVIFDEYYDDWSKPKAVILHCGAEVASGPELEHAWSFSTKSSSRPRRSAGRRGIHWGCGRRTGGMGDYPGPCHISRNERPPVL